ncbi:MAG: RnfABCDGE type electron transport complex subunit B [Nitrospirota bacterium]|nr:RnfABCDGE type electron transport complex subunit B [Nitrospirota bacterium]
MLAAILTLGGMGAVAGLGLGFASKRFAVAVDARLEELLGALPGINCGACGFAGCRPCADAINTGAAKVNACPVGGEGTVIALATIMGVEPEASIKQYARIFCTGGVQEARRAFQYQGMDDCNAAVLVSGGGKACVFGCLGLGSCVSACPYDAMYMNENAIPVVIDSRCTGCTLCAPACPKDLIQMIPAVAEVQVLCNSTHKGSEVKKVCTVGCISCDICVKVCPYEAITINAYLAEIDYGKCTNCGLCVAKCPDDTILDFSGVRPRSYILPEPCTGCTLCRDVCPTNAISGELDKLHVVDVEKCIGCYMCKVICPENAVDMRGPGAYGGGVRVQAEPVPNRLTLVQIG